MDKESLSKSFDDSRKSEIELRRKYGFGKSEEEYPENDWRNKMTSNSRKKYRGTTLDPQIDPRDANKGSSYLEDMGDFPIYGDVKDKKPRIDPILGVQKLALKQNISSTLKEHNTENFIIDNDGNIIPTSESFIKFVSGNFKKLVDDSSRDVEMELEKDEKEFARELDSIINKFKVKQFITHKIAYMTATVIDDKTKEKKPIYFINNQIHKLDGTVDMNPTQARDIINKYLKDKLEYKY